MEPFHEYIGEYRLALEKGAIQKAYRGLMETMQGLRTELSARHPDYFVSGSLYTGYMDMTYFSFTPRSLKERQLKVAIVFTHAPFRFEAWLGGYNKQVQARYWKLFQEHGWQKYPLVATLHGSDAIIESVMMADPDFRDLDALTTRIEQAALQFIADVEDFFVEHAL